MTTFEPGASVVFTQGLLVRPRSTAFFARSAAATITDGLDVFVHDVPSASVIGVGLDVRPRAPFAADGAAVIRLSLTLTGSDAGNDSSPASSRASCTESPSV